MGSDGIAARFPKAIDKRVLSIEEITRKGAAPRPLSAAGRRTVLAMPRGRAVKDWHFSLPTSWVAAAIVTSVCVVLAGVCARAGAEEAPERLTIVVFGDSQGRGVAEGLQRVLIDNTRFKVLNRTHPGAAFVHGEAEWIAPIRKFLSQEKADLAIVMFGANDRLDMKEGDAATYLHFKSAAWRDEYARRTDMVLKALVDGGVKVIWCGNPIARSETYSSDMSYINQIFAERAELFGAQFLPLWETAAGEDGKYTAYGKDLGGVTRRLRADDGIHFTAAGYELIAEKIAGLFPSSPADGQQTKEP
jgi:hypothetical protein